MPATVRDILLMIRAKEDATRTLSKVSAAMRGTAATADSASARARAAALRSQAQQAKLAGASKTQVDALRQQADAYDKQAKSMDAANKKSKILAATVGDVGHVMTTTGIVMAGMGAAGLLGLKQAIDVASDWDKQVRLTFTQVDKRYKPSLQALSDIGLRVSRNIAVPFETIQDALFDVFSSTEANMPQAEYLLTQFSKAAVAGQTDIQTASRATIGLMNSFKVPFKDVNKLLDIQFQLVQEGVGTYEEWASRIGLVSPSAVRAGQTVEMMAAALATATRQGMNSARASTSVARAFDAMSNPKTEKNLKEIGVASRDAKGNFRPMVDVLADWRKQLDKMPKEDRVKNILDVLKGAGGTIEARRFLQNILLSKGGLELFQDQVKEFATDKGAFQRGYDEMAGSIASKTQLLHNAWMQFKLGIGQALVPTFTLIVDKMQQLLDWFNKLPQPVKDNIAKFALLGSALLIAGGILTTIVGIFLTFAGVVATAGSALLPMIGLMAGIAAGGTLVVAALVAIGAALVVAYQNSAPFREFISSIAGFFVAAGSAIGGFATQVWNAFSANLLPALKQLWGVIQTQVLPAVTNFVNWCKAELIPIAQRVGTWFMTYLAPAFAAIGAVITSQVIPAIKDLVNWWNENQAVIQPVIKALMYVGGVMALLAAVPIAALIAALVAIGFALRVLVTIFTVTWNAIKKIVQVAVSSIGNPIENIKSKFKSIGDAAKKAWSVVSSVFSGGIAKIKAAFSGAGAWLISAGANIVQGLINGIRSRIGAAASQAASLAKSVLNSAMGALGIKSPSTKFKDIGVNIVRGLTEGVKSSATRKQLDTAMFNITRDIRRSISAADITKSAKSKMMARWNNTLASTTTRLMRLEDKRVALQTRLAAAQKSVNDQIKVRDDLAGKIKDSLLNQGDLTSLTDKEKKSSTSIASGLRQRLKELQDFQTNLRNLAKRGFDKETIATLASQGVDQAGALVKTIAMGSQQDLTEISKLEQQIRAIATQTGTNVAGDLYNAGIKAGQGLVKGLESQIGAITKQMTTIATALIKAIKKELGIKSPSQVFENIGVNTAKGYVNGYVAKMNAEKNNLANSTLFNPAANVAGGRVASGGVGGRVYNMGTSKTITNHIIVHTQEIDPRKTSADLGWELAARL